MSLIQDLDDIKNKIRSMGDKAARQQCIYYDVIALVVRMHQRHRVAGDYAVSDEIRDLLKSVGVIIVQGTAGYDYEKIPDALKGRPVDDQWKIETI